MKRFIFSISVVTLVFIGLGSLVPRTGATFKSDEKALELVRKARLAIGGDAAINAIQSMRIVGTTSHKVKINGVESNQTGETEIALMLPDKLMKMTKIVSGDGGSSSSTAVQKQIDVVVVENGKPAPVGSGEGSKMVKKIVIKTPDGTEKVYTGADADKIEAENTVGGNVSKKIIIKHPDGTEQVYTGPEADKMIQRDGDSLVVTADGNKKIIVDDKVTSERAASMRQNELLATTLGLLLTAPQGMDVEYTSGGDADLAGTPCDLVVATFAGQAYKLFLDRSSSMPVGMTFPGFDMPHAISVNKVKPENGSDEAKVIIRHDAAPAPTEITVKFSDYRGVGGVQLPFRWTHMTGGGTATFEVTNYEINPPNIAEKFQNQKVMVRVPRVEVQK